MPIIHIVPPPNPIPPLVVAFRFTLRSSSNDGEVQRLFDSACDADGLMQKSDIMKMEEIAALLDQEDLRWEEFDMFWERAPKFPTDSSKIDVDR